MSQFFETLIFNKDRENVHYVPEINLISYEILIKANYLSNKKKLKEIWDTVL